MKPNDYNFAVTEQEANLILNALAELPAKVSMNLIAKLQQQAAGQIQAEPVAKAEAV